MIQGTGCAGKWTAENIEKICKEVGRASNNQNKNEITEKEAETVANVKTPSLNIITKSSSNTTPTLIKPKRNILVEYKMYGDKIWKKSKTCHTQPNPNGKDKEWVNIHVDTDTKGSINWRLVEQWREVKAHENASSSRRKSTDDCIKRKQQLEQQKLQLMPLHQQNSTPIRQNQQLTISFPNIKQNGMNVSMKLTHQQITHLLNLTQRQMMLKPKIKLHHKMSLLKPSLQQMITFAEAFKIATGKHIPKTLEVPDKVIPNQELAVANTNIVTEVPTTTENENIQIEDNIEENYMNEPEDLSAFLLSLPATLSSALNISIESRSKSYDYQYRNSQLIPDLSDESDYENDNNLTHDQFNELIRKEYENPSPPHQSVIQALNLIPRTTSTPIIKPPKLIIKPNTESKSHNNQTKLSTMKDQQRE